MCTHTHTERVKKGFQAIRGFTELFLPPILPLSFLPSWLPVFLRYRGLNLTHPTNQASNRPLSCTLAFLEAAGEKEGLRDEEKCLQRLAHQALLCHCGKGPSWLLDK